MISSHLNISASATAQTVPVSAGADSNRRPVAMPGMNLEQWNNLVQELQGRVKARIDMYLSQSTIEAGSTATTTASPEPQIVHPQADSGTDSGSLHVNLVA